MEFLCWASSKCLKVDSIEGALSLYVDFCFEEEETGGGTGLDLRLVLSFESEAFSFSKLSLLDGGTIFEPLVCITFFLAACFCLDYVSDFFPGLYKLCIAW